MRLSLRLFLLTFLLQFSSWSQFSVGAFGGYNLLGRLNVGLYTEYALDESFMSWSSSFRFAYTYTIPYSRPGDNEPVVKSIPGNHEGTASFARTTDKFYHHSFFIEYKDYSDDYEEGPYWKSIIGISTSKVKREWLPGSNANIIANNDLFTIRQISLNLGLGGGYELNVSDNISIYGELSAMLPFIKLSSNSKKYDRFPDISLGLQLGVKYKLFKA